MRVPTHERVRAYLATIPGAVLGSQGSNHTFNVACSLVKGFCLEKNTALSLLQEWNSKCSPPWSDTELEHKIDDAEKSNTTRGYGWLLEKKIEQSNKWEPKKKTIPLRDPSSPQFDPIDWKNRKIADSGAEIFKRLSPLTAKELGWFPILDPTENFETFLTAFPPEKILWMGHVLHSSQKNDNYISRFASVSTWLARGLPPPDWMWTSFCCFFPGSTSRCITNVESQPYFVVESDKNPKPTQRAVINFLQKELSLKLKMVNDAGGVSLHAWFSTQGLSQEFMNRLKIMLCGIPDGMSQNPDGSKTNKSYGGMGVDPATMRLSQAVRLPGIERPQPDGSTKLQHIVYFNHDI